MNSPAGALQKAIFAALRADAGLRAFFGPVAPRIYDLVPVDAQTGKVTATFPFIQIGEDDVLDSGDQCEDGAETHFNIHVWSRAGGKVEAREIGRLVGLVLDADINPDGHAIVVHQIAQDRDIPSGDGGLTAHRLVVARYVTATPLT
jgi:hypothetical protein